MKTGRIGDDAFAYYLSLGAERSYAAVAKRYVVSKRAVTRRALLDNWSERLAAAQSKSRERQEADAVESLAEMSLRHGKVLKAMTAKALETLRQVPLETAMDAVRTLDLVLKQERAARGEPEGETKSDLVEIIRRENERWLVASEGGEQAPGASSDR